MPPRAALRMLVQVRRPRAAAPIPATSGVLLQPLFAVRRQDMHSSPARQGIALAGTHLRRSAC